mgnify:CR=1 FL=1
MRSRHPAATAASGGGAKKHSSKSKKSLKRTPGGVTGRNVRAKANASTAEGSVRKYAKAKPKKKGERVGRGTAIKGFIRRLKDLRALARKAGLA